MVGRRHSITVAGTARLAQLLALIVMVALLPSRALADPADIEAASRGVVRVVIVERDGDEIIPVSHGTGFAISQERIVTNAHVVAEARNDSNLSIGIVPSDGENAVYGRLIAYSARKDLAIVGTTSPMYLPPLTIAGNPERVSGAVTAIGYPMNVDRAQGLSITDIFHAQPPVTSTGFLSGSRPTREFDSLLHTAPIARGNSGGPLVDSCGRVIGVNSFGAESGGADAEFFFAVSTRELLNFLRTNDITPQVNGLPCRSLADLDAEERDRAERTREAERMQAQADKTALTERRDDARREVGFALIAERENWMGLSGLLMIVVLGAGGFAWRAWERADRRDAKIAGGVAIVALIGAGVAWLSRPGFDQIEDRLNDMLRAEVAAKDTNVAKSGKPEGKMVCVLNPDRSRVTGAANEDVPFEWSDQGCVNQRTQYGRSAGTWTRVFVPSDEAAVSVSRFDPSRGEYRVDRYLLSYEDMEKARAARKEFQAPACGAKEEAVREFGAQQSVVLSLLPQQPNERLVYNCHPAS